MQKGPRFSPFSVTPETSNSSMDFTSNLKPYARMVSSLTSRTIYDNIYLLRVEQWWFNIRCYQSANYPNDAEIRDKKSNTALA